MDKLAIKISVSLPEALKAQLDQYVVDNGGSASQVVQQALEAFFSPAVPPPPPEPDLQLQKLVLQLSADVQFLRNELERTQRVLDRHREFLVGLRPLTDLAGVALSLPPELFS